jgi:hypothetical protein
VGRYRTVLTTVVIVAFVVTLPAFVLAARAYAASHTVTAPAEGTLSFTSAPGEELALGIELTGAVGDHWASRDGVHLVLDGFDRPFVVVAPRRRTWGNRITVSSGDDAAFVEGRVLVPPDVAAARTVTGRLQGSYVHPAPGAPTRAGPGFQDETKRVDLPVELRLVEPGEFAWSSGQRFFMITAGLALVLAAVMVALAIAAVAGAVRRRQPVIKNLAGLFMAPVVVVLVLGGGGRAVTLGFERRSVDPPYFMAITVAIAVLAGVAGWLAMAASED